MKKNLLFKVLLLALMGALTSASAVVAEPTSFANFVNVLFEIVKGTAGQLAMALILGFSGYKAWQTNSWGPLIWGAVAIVLIAGGPIIAHSLTTNVNTFMNLP